MAGAVFATDPMRTKMSQISSLFEVAESFLGGVELKVAVPEFVDNLLLAATKDSKLAMIFECPKPTGDAKVDALLAAIARHIAIQYRLEDLPGWVRSDDRILAEPWFTSKPTSMAMQLKLVTGSPPAFRLHNIFPGDLSLDRAA